MRDEGRKVASRGELLMNAVKTNPTDKKETLNLIDYAEREILPFSEKPPTPVDELILSWFSYLKLPPKLDAARSWQGIKVIDTFRIDCFDNMYGELWDSDSSARLLRAMAANPRYREIEVFGYRSCFDEDEEKQFAAVSLRLTPDLVYVSYRGTDSSFVGWKEDFNLSFLYPVPSQEEAARYLDEIALHTTGRMIAGGHSKGGNLAVYAAMHCSESTLKRIDHVCSHDGPGFPEAIFSDGSFDRVAPLVEKILPRSSIVGMLLEHQEDYRIIKSSNFSVMQHDPFSWVVEGDDFVEVEGRTAGARYMDITLNTWVKSLTNGERERVIGVVYKLVEELEVESFCEFGNRWTSYLPQVVSKIQRLDADERELVVRVANNLVALSYKMLPEAIRRS